MIEWTDILIRLVTAAIFGGLVGLERERKNWTAGLRTHMMVCTGAALMMIVSSFGFSEILKSEYIRLDPSRVAAQVVSGIGFLGAGTILFSKEGTVRGLTTAAGLWTVAGIGLATGGGMFIAAIITTCLALIILWAIQPIEKRYNERFAFKTLTIVTTRVASISVLLEKLDSVEKIRFSNFHMERSGEDVVYKLFFEGENVHKIEKFIDELQKDKDIKKVTWQK